MFNFNKEMLDLFWNFVFERQNVWYKRVILKEKYPWTKDKIIQKERFTNIYRELDPGTKYAVENILELDENKKDKMFNVMFYRLVGSSNTYKYIGFQRLKTFNEKEVEKKLKYLRDVEKRPIFTAAYMVGGYTKMGSKDKVENVVKLFSKLRDGFDSFYNKIENSKSSEEVYECIKSEYGFGNFLSYQILVDLCYPLKIYNGKGLLPYSNDEWSCPGPGARRGINLLVKNKVNYLEFMKWLRDNQEKEFIRLGLNFPYLKENSKITKLSLANIQNSLCEFHKYVKISDGTGRGRRKFKLV